MKSGIQQIIDERNSQLTKGRDAQHDEMCNKRHQLTYAVAILLHIDYARDEIKREWKKEQGRVLALENYMTENCPPGWDLAIWKKMLHKPYHERVAICGALCAAEIDRSIFANDFSSPGLINSGPETTII